MMKQILFWLFLILLLCSLTNINAQVRYADSVIAYSSQYSENDWSANQILGPPDTYPKYGDIPTAWTFATADAQREFIELRFPDPAQVQAMAIYETYNPGTIDTIYVKNPNTLEWQAVWSGTAAPLRYPDSRIFMVNFPQTSFMVSEVRLAINSPAVPDWNELDAVGLYATPITLQLPDLALMQVQTPTQAWSGQTISISWTVKNIGSASTPGATWLDHLYLIRTDSPDSETAVFEHDYDNVSSLDVGESYSNTQSIVLPLGLDGNYSVFVYADIKHSIAESLKVNNLLSSAPMLLHLSPEPDLAVTSLTVPRVIFAGDTVPVSFTVKNIGTAPTTENSWQDQILLIPDTVLNLSEAVVLADIDRDGNLQIDSSYQVSIPVVIPHDAIGKYYIFAYADRWRQVFENNFEFNNIRSSDSISIVGVAPDLTVTSVIVPPNGNSGMPLPVEWTVRNVGVGVTYETTWSDAVFLSPSSPFNEGDATRLLQVDHDGALAHDSSYHVSTRLVLPNGISGPYYVFVRTDNSHSVFENGATENNVGRSDTTINVTLSPWPDLQVSAVRAPEHVSAGKQASVSWTVTNTGVGPTISDGWTDRVYISADSIWGGSHIDLTDAAHISALAPGSSYSQTATVTIPPTVSGTAYIYVMTDVDDVVYENTGEGNNVSGSDSLIVQGYPPVDLTVTSFSIPDTGTSGDTLTLLWTVRNAGSGRTISDSWSDVLYIASDSVFDADTDVVVGRLDHEGALDSAGTYTRMFPITLPNDLSGPYYWFVQTDKEGRSGDTALRNNVLRSPRAMYIRLLPLPDLSVVSVVTADSVNAGQPTMVRWTVQNIGGGPARNSYWDDAVYLSEDSILDKADQKLGTVNFDNGPLQSMASYTDSVKAFVDKKLFGFLNFFKVFQLDFLAIRNP